MPKATVEVIRCSRDARGFVFEPAGLEFLPSQRNVHVALTEPGAIRGNHYHERGTEVAVVIGPALVRFREDGQVRDVQVPGGEAQRFTIPPGVGHAFQNTGNKPLLLVAFSTVAFDTGNPDIVRDHLI
jgi:UDP-2-acetamido-2,6-beta-L-arabino-hexul-4-ose reductase